MVEVKSYTLDEKVISEFETVCKSIEKSSQIGVQINKSQIINHLISVWCKKQRELHKL